MGALVRTVTPVSNTMAATVTSLLAKQLEHDPSATYAILPGQDDDVEPVKVSFQDFAFATRRFARLIQPTTKTSGAGPIPGSSKTGVIGLLIHCDTLLYATALSGVIAAGYTVFPISPRNSPVAVAHLLRSVSARRLLVTSTHLATLVAEVKALFHSSCTENGVNELLVEELPTFADVYPHLAGKHAEKFSRRCLGTRYEDPHEDRHEEVEELLLRQPHTYSGNVEMYLHSSGSTGLPKPIAYTHAVLESHAHFTWVSEIIKNGRPMVLGGLSLPTFHAMGMLCHLLYPLFTGYPTAMYQPQSPRPPVVTGPQIAMNALRRVGANFIFVVPAFLETWTHDDSAIAYLKSVDIVAFAGGPLTTTVGHQLLEAGCRVTSVYGGTEFGPVTRLFPIAARPTGDDALSWCEFGAYIRPRWRDLGDNMFELELLMSEKHVLAQENLGDVRGYATRDLWTPHPYIEGLWRIIARVDDVIILSTGEKIVPGPMENDVLANPGIKSVVMFGRGRAHAGMLVELQAGASSHTPAASRQLIWPSVEAANQHVPTFARLHQEMIIFVDPQRPLPLTPKGTVLRKAALAVYEDDIEQLYSHLKHRGVVHKGNAPLTWSEADILSWILQVAGSVKGCCNIQPSTRLFDQGFDSLSATVLRNRIVAALRASTSASEVKEHAIQAVTAHIAYATASPIEIAAALAHLAQDGRSVFKESTVEDVMSLVEKYTKSSPDIPAPEARKVRKRKRSEVVVAITGTTGGLGSHLLDECLRHPNIVRVYALNRRRDSGPQAYERQEQSFCKRVINKKVLESSKLEFIEYAAGEHRLGLDDETYDKLLTTVNVVIHNAWQLDFTLPLRDFEPHLSATRDLLDLVQASALEARLVFISSVGVAGRWSSSKGLVPEIVLEDPGVCLGLGYGESKYVAERIVHSRRQAGLDAVILRVGQIAGSERTGAWSPQDWIPIIIKSGVTLGSLPTTDGVVSWLPMDNVVRITMDTVMSLDPPPPVLNIVHPKPTPWNTIFRYVADALHDVGVLNAPSPLISSTEWLHRLRSESEQVGEDRIQAIPALKMMNFLNALASNDARSTGKKLEAGGAALFDTTVARSTFSSLEWAEPLNRKQVVQWVSYWQFEGYFRDVMSDS